jgi:hypothetical protein
MISDPTDDPLQKIADLVRQDYTLYLRRDHIGVCIADLSRGVWPFRKRVTISLDRQQFEQAKRFLGAAPKRDVRVLKE